MATVESIRKNNLDEEKIWQIIKRQVEELKYGTVLITVHDGKITQIETSSKIRF